MLGKYELEKNKKKKRVSGSVSFGVKSKLTRVNLGLAIRIPEEAGSKNLHHSADLDQMTIAKLGYQTFRTTNRHIYKRLGWDTKNSKTHPAPDLE